MSAGTRWHARLDVVLLPGELRIAGNGGIWRYRVADMVQVSADPDASTDPDGSGAIRVEFLRGDPLVVTVRDGGTLLGALQRQLEGYEWALRCDGVEAVRQVPEHVVDGRFTTPIHTVTPAIDLLNARRKGDDDPTLPDRRADVREAARRSRVEILRARRRDLLSVGSARG